MWPFINQTKEGKMKQFKWVSIWLTLIAVAAVLAITGCAGKGYTPENAPSEFLCAVDNNVDIDVAGEAELADFACSYKKWAGAVTLHIKVAVKNLSDKPQRYKVNIFLDNGKGVGGLIPRKTAKGLVEPGKTASFVYPVQGVTQQPKEVILKIRAMD
jgi:hypothetical protein